MDKLVTNPNSKPEDEVSLNISGAIGQASADKAATIGKYYYKADRIKHYYIQQPEEVDELYAEGTVPKVGDLVASCLQDGYTLDLEKDDDQLIVNQETGNVTPHYFHKGDWVEYRGNDMVWDLEQITLVVLQADDSWDYVANRGQDPPLEEMAVFYNLGKKGLVPASEVRAPAEGLKAIFGMRPFLWQQHCLLQIERRLRFQKDHEYDFEELDCELFAERRFEEWLNAVGNEKFLAYFQSHSPLVQKLLRIHLYTPFQLMDEVTENRDLWDFEDKDITIYTYFGILGSGVITVILTVAIQMLAIAVLLLNSTREYNGEPNERFFLAPDGTVQGVFIFGLLPETDFDTFCNNNGSIEGKILIGVVLTMYFIQVIPDSWRQFYKVSGASETTYSKINSLRSTIWKDNDDTISQQIGFKLDRYMNIGFTCLVYWSMLFLLFNTPHVLDIILNALAIEFIHQFDERLADSEWWDPDNRYIMAGTQEMVIRASLSLNAFINAHRFCKEFDIDPAEYKEALGSMDLTLANEVLGRSNDKSRDYMSKNETLWAEFAAHAKETNNKRAWEHFNKIPGHYGFIEQILYKIGLSDQGIFQRYLKYRVWSRWEKLLYLPRVPTSIEDKDVFDKSVLYTQKNCCGLGTEVEQRSYFYDFTLHVIRVLTFRETFDSVMSVIKFGRVAQVPWRVVDGILQFISYALQVLFPVYVLLGLSLVPYCY